MASRRLVDARYEYNWNPLIGSLAGVLRALDRAAEMAAISAVSAAAFALPPVEEGFAPRPAPLDLPSALGEGLRALGVAAEITQRDQPPARLAWSLLNRRLRRDLAQGRPIVAARAGVDPFGPAFGLIVGFDDERRAWRRDGPMTEQIGPWLPYDELRSVSPLVIVRLRAAALPDRTAIGVAARRAEANAADAARAELGRWIEILEGGEPIDPQGHARAAQAFAAAIGEAAAFWREYDRDAPECARAQALAVALSRFATLFPYPMGGAPNARGVRAAGAAILRDVLARIAH